MGWCGLQVRRVGGICGSSDGLQVRRIGGIGGNNGLQVKRVGGIGSSDGLVWVTGEENGNIELVYVEMWGIRLLIL